MGSAMNLTGLRYEVRRVRVGVGFSNMSLRNVSLQCFKNGNKKLTIIGLDRYGLDLAIGCIC